MALAVLAVLAHVDERDLAPVGEPRLHRHGIDAICHSCCSRLIALLSRLREIPGCSVTPQRPRPKSPTAEKMFRLASIPGFRRRGKRCAMLRTDRVRRVLWKLLS